MPKGVRLDRKRGKPGYKAPAFNPATPLRSWDEVAEEYNRRHPDDPIADGNSARGLGARAMKKLARKIKLQDPQLAEEA